MKTFEAKNINCQSCANAIKVEFEDEFADIEVDVEKKQVSLSIDEKDIANFKQQMSELGFEVVKRIDE